jgi:cyclomaltodextrinase / maltogenic alpha-amylase / neopullulanase
MRGMHVILDGVFNHTGRDFFAFADLRAHQAASPYKSWYVVTSFDAPNTEWDEFKYKGWRGHDRLPVFAATSDGKDIAPGPKAYIFNATKRWMDPDGDGKPADGIDGWRLDAADDRPAQFWVDWHAHVRGLNPNAYTSAET